MTLSNVLKNNENRKKRKETHKEENEEVCVRD